MSEINRKKTYNLPTNNHVLKELPITQVQSPAKTEYDCDVLVIGGGFAGIMAAVYAKEAGRDVILVDKGYPGYSGQSAWASCHTYFDPEFGDNKEEYEYLMAHGNDYIANMNWAKIWETESKPVYEKFKEMGLLKQYPRAMDTGYWVDGSPENDRIAEYHKAHLKDDRHALVSKALKQKGIPFIYQTMILDIVEENGRVMGAVGLHYKSATVLKFNAKAVVLAAGSGCFKSGGVPISEDTFDAEYIGYKHGIPVTGQEFEDYHLTNSFAPGYIMMSEGWAYLENYWIGAPTGATPDTINSIIARSSGIIKPFFASANGIVKPEKLEFRALINGSGTETGHPDDHRNGKSNSPVWKGNLFGAAPGCFAHFAGGLFCGIDDVEGKTQIEGLWVAGEGANGCMVSGGSKRCPGGMTSNFAGVQGKIAGQAAADYSKNVELVKMPQDKVWKLETEIMAPMHVERGFHPNWARDVLNNTMAPYWISIAKDEDSLKNALNTVKRIQKEVIPNLRADSGHELRLCHEMKHKALVAELKLLASLERKESRGYHYRKDYPYRDDSYLCYITLRKGDDDEVVVEKVDIMDEWKGDLTQTYDERYGVWHYPGELEYLANKEKKESEVK